MGRSERTSLCERTAKRQLPLIALESDDSSGIIDTLLRFLLAARLTCFKLLISRNRHLNDEVSTASPNGYDHVYKYQINGRKPSDCVDMSSLNLFQIKQEITDPDDVIVDREKLWSHPIEVAGQLLGVLYVQRTARKPPRWLPYFEDLVDFTGIRLETASAAAVLLVKRQETEGRVATSSMFRTLYKPTFWRSQNPKPMGRC